MSVRGRGGPVDERYAWAPALITGRERGVSSVILATP